MTQPEFSVIIPVFDRAAKLKRAIESVRRANRSSLSEVEIVVVDDASHDGSAEVARILNVDHVVVLEKNIGVTGARKRGVAESRGSFLVFLDSDDELHPDAFLRMRAHFEHYSDTDILFGACVDRTGESMHRRDAVLGRVTYQHYLVHSAPGEFLPVVRREVFRSLTYEESLRGFEGVTWLKAARQGFVLHFSAEVMRVYDRDGDDRLCRRENMLRGADRLAKGWHFFLCEFGSDLWRFGRRAYFKSVFKWSIYERLQTQHLPRVHAIPVADGAFAWFLAVAVRSFVRLVPRGVWVWCYSARGTFFN